MPFRRTAVDFGVGGERGAFSKFFDSHGTVVVLAPESNFFFLPISGFHGELSLHVGEFLAARGPL